MNQNQRAKRQKQLSRMFENNTRTLLPGEIATLCQWRGEDIKHLQIEVDRLRSLVYILHDEDPCAAEGHYCTTHECATGLAGMLCPHGMARAVLPADYGKTPPTDWGQWLVDINKEK